MSIQNFVAGSAGQVGNIPQIDWLHCNDSYATITSLNYLRGAVSDGYQIAPTDVIFASYASHAFGIFTPSITATGITLVPLSFSSSVIDVKGLQVVEATNGFMGRAVLSGGTVTVANTSVAANSEIFVTGQIPGGTPGACNISGRTAGTSFTITSTNGADTSTVAWLMVNPG